MGGCTRRTAAVFEKIAFSPEYIFFPLNLLLYMAKMDFYFVLYILTVNKCFFFCITEPENISIFNVTNLNRVSALNMTSTKSVFLNTRTYALFVVVFFFNLIRVNKTVFILGLTYQEI